MSHVTELGHKAPAVFPHLFPFSQVSHLGKLKITHTTPTAEHVPGFWSTKFCHWPVGFAIQHFGDTKSFHT